MTRDIDIKCFVLSGGGILLVAPDGRTECTYSPHAVDGGSAAGMREHFAMIQRGFEQAVERLCTPAYDLAKESTPAPVGSGG